jgi:tetratricopeptide (TPR) repeat protein
MHRVVTASLFVLAAFAAPPPGPDDVNSSALKERWERIGTPDLELYTDAGNTAAREALGHLQQVREFFLKASPLPLLDQFPVRIILFKTEEQFAPYQTTEGQRAFFVNSPKRDYIVMADSPGEYRFAIHEYMHLIVRHSGLRLPTWLNEGWAEVYSTLKPVPDGVAVGDLVDVRMKTLETGQWLDIGTLTTTDRQSDLYRGKGPVAMFYAESWALAHMLFLAPDYTDNFPKFLMAIHRGRNFGESCQAAFGKTSAEVYADLRKYFDRKKMYGKVFAAQLGKKSALPDISKVDQFDLRLVLADLLAATGHRLEAKETYAELSRAEPDRYEVPESLGYLAFIEKDLPEARREFERAFASGDPDPRMCLQLAVLQESSGQPTATIMASLGRALQSKPDYADAILQLGLVRIAAGEYQSGVATLMKVGQIRPQQAAPVYSALAYGYLRLGDLARARKDAETAKQYAGDADQAKRLAAMLALIDARAVSPLGPKPGEKTERVEGALQRIDCTPGGNRMLLTIGNRLMTFDLPDAKAIEFVQKGKAALTIACGPQKPLWVTVEFAASSVVDKASDGVVRRLEY